MQYYDDNCRAGKRAGAIAAAVYALMLIALMLFVDITLHTRETGEGILIDFGDVEQAGGTMPAASDPLPAPASDPDGIATQDIEDAPEVVQRVEQPPRTPDAERQPSAPAVEPQRTADPNALFPASGNRGGDRSQGSGDGEGRQGDRAGTPGASPDGTGAGDDGAGFSLAGRSVMGSLPEPRYGPQKQGRVVVEITVDAAGRVVRAVPRLRGSTTNDSELVDAAVEAAGRARFNVADGAALQTGTITYNFRLK